MKTGKLPFQVRIASPCLARWTDMNGDDRVRFCTLCQKNVYNLSAMTSQEATAFLNKHRGPLCARIYQRKDGTVITFDCPLGIREYWRRLKRLASAGAAAILLTFGYTTALARDDGSSVPDDLRDRITGFFDNATETVLDWFGFSVRGKVMGGVSISPTTPLPTPSAVNNASDRE